MQAVACPPTELPAGLARIVKTADAAGWWTTATRVTYPATRRARTEDGMVDVDYGGVNVQVKGWHETARFVVQYVDGKPGPCYHWTRGRHPSACSVTELKARLVPHDAGTIKA